ncbi:Uncharacterized protein TCM_017555 [Theobroma cacao]|uniref:Uncharacterized protein n=1 Tax=Theobroma cacao TaxID=3641 RepID=A0A061EFC8_THECC|nr:Uncharacterized protein TCM_017555 [Theobroma cacao]
MDIKASWHMILRYLKMTLDMNKHHSTAHCIFHKSFRAYLRERIGRFWLVSVLREIKTNEIDGKFQPTKAH